MENLNSGQKISGEVIIQDIHTNGNLRVDKVIYFEEVLANLYENLPSVYKKNNKIKKLKSIGIDTWGVIFEEDIFLDFDFVKQLNVQEIISLGCFSAKNDWGESVLEFLSKVGDVDFKFRVVRKDWITPYEISLILEAFNDQKVYKISDII